jgi:hypothetical protein
MSDKEFLHGVYVGAFSQRNGACEGFFGRLKTELFYPRDWKTITIEQFVAEVDADTAGTRRNASRYHWDHAARLNIATASA